ncbi:MAG: ABC transporter ATP-binding protein, partial [Candidatus Izemoplasmatales bacterium]|nr:ABC transporter ATP-binding protein [Candidatus Izemoplasmatales bacterium]
VTHDLLVEKNNVPLIEFKDVSFRYKGAEEYVVENINLSIKHGETVAFIGSTGSGKSSLINLIPRFYDTSKGSILINGVDVSDYAQEDLHKIIGYIPQKGTLFSGTIRSNIQIGSENATDDEINEALDIAQATEFVSSLELGLDAPISQGGKNFSGGQKQRLSIARAIVKKPEIYIFDDSFSALDYQTDKVLRKALNTKLPESTKLIVAQRIGTILYADKIVVLEKGKIVGVGTHTELLETCSVYKEIALSQLSQEEINYGKK